MPCEFNSLPVKIEFFIIFLKCIDILMNHPVVDPSFETMYCTFSFSNALSNIFKYRVGRKKCTNSNNFLYKKALDM